MRLVQLIDIIKHLTSSNFYGSVEIKFENGKILLCRKIEIIKGESAVSEKPSHDS